MVIFIIEQKSTSKIDASNTSQFQKIQVLPVQISRWSRLSSRW